MTRRPLACMSISLLLVCIVPHLAEGQPETEDYVIDRYELTVEAQGASADVRVTMDITYLIKSGMKSSGFKYIGNYKAEGLAGRDGEENQIRTWVEQHRETRINWSFNPTGPGKKRVKISFTIPDALTGALNENSFEANWAGIFKVNAGRAVYRFVFPDSNQRTIRTTPPDLTDKIQGGRRVIECSQNSIKEKAFRVTFSPGITDRNRDGKYDSSNLSSSSNFPIGLIIAGLVTVGAALVVFAIVRNAKRARPHSSSVSSCAGGSSCSSSSCGSSCGGGCGGGCGG